MVARRPRTKAVASGVKTAEKKMSEPVVEAAPIAERESTAVPTEVMAEMRDPVPASAEAVQEEAVPPQEATDPEEAHPDAQAPERETARRTGYGWVNLGGQEYRFDVVVHVDGSVTKRDKKLSRKKKKRYGRIPLTYRELTLVLGDDPELIIIGTGQRGKMPITPKAQRLLDTRNSFIAPTPFALDWMETDKRRSVAILHVTK